MKKTYTDRVLAALLIFLIIFCTAATAFAATGSWEKNSYGWWYKYSDGTYPKNQWEQIDGTWYYFDSAGYMLTDQWVGSCYVTSSGAMAENQWVGDYYCGSEGLYVKNRWVGNCYCGSDGRRLKNCTQTIDGKKYRFDSSGNASEITSSEGDSGGDSTGEDTGESWKEGWNQKNGEFYYSQNGTLVKNNWVHDGGNWYFCNAEGKMVTGQYVIPNSRGENSTYFFKGAGETTSPDCSEKPYGSMYTDTWVRFGGSQYWTDSDGRYHFNEYIENGGALYWVGSNGAWDPAYDTSQYGIMSSVSAANADGTSGTYGRTYAAVIDDGRSPSLNACCMDPANQHIPYSGTKVILTKLSNSSLLARVAYCGSQNYGTQNGKYVLSRAAAYAAGNVSKNNYQQTALVNSLYNRAAGMTSAPASFEAYEGSPTNGQQKFIVWRDKGSSAGKGSLRKTDTDTGKGLSGAKFEIRTDWDNSLKGTFLTDSEGNAGPVLLDAGLYKVTEVAAPDGYVIDSTPHAMTISAGGNTVISVKNKKAAEENREGKAYISKGIRKNESYVSLHPDEYSLGGAVYGIYEDSGCSILITTLTTSQKSWNSAESDTAVLDAGTYYAKEITAPKGFYKDSGRYKFDVIKDKTTKIAVSDEPEPHSEPVPPTPPAPVNGKAYIVKGIEKNEKLVQDCPAAYSLGGAVYGIYTDSSCTNKISTLTTTGVSWSRGQSDVISLNPGTYFAKELTAPNGFNLDYSVHKFTVKAGETTVVNVNDIPEVTDGKIELTKVIPEESVYSYFGNPTAIFELTCFDTVTSEKRVLIKSVTLDNSTLTSGYYRASVVFDNLPAGEYYARELKTARYRLKGITDISPNGNVSGAMVHFTLDASDTSGCAVFENTLTKWNNLSHSECVVNRF